MLQNICSGQQATSGVNLSCPPYFRKGLCYSLKTHHMSFQDILVSVFHLLKKLWVYRCVLLYLAFQGSQKFKLRSSCLGSKCFTTEPLRQLPALKP